jgi:hypothetical protein
MADDNNARYRPDASFGRDPGPAGHGSDPLAELARLIGQNDPFVEADRGPPQHDGGQRYASADEPPQYYRPDPLPGFAPEQQYHRSQDYAPARQYAPEPDYRAAPAHGREPALPPLPNFGSDPLFGEPLPRQAEAPPQRYADDLPPQPDWPPGPAAPPPFHHDPFALPSIASAQQAASPAEPRFDPPRFDTPGFGAPPHPAAGNFPADVPGFDPPPQPYRHASDGPPFAAPPLYPSEPDAGAMPPPHDDEFYDDAPRNDRRKGMVTVVAVLCLAVLGTAAAFGYRSLFGGPSSSSPPPIIRASSEPSKVPPPPGATVDPNANKITYDRFGDRSQNEQVVVREETPVDTSELARAASPRPVLPGVPSLTNPPVQTGANPPSTIGEPRRVRTVPIRPEGSDLAFPSQSVASQPPQAAAAPAQRQTAGAAPSSNAPLELSPTATARAPVAQPQQRTVARAAPPPPPRQAQPSANAPLSLSPDGALPQSSVVREPPQRTARAAAATSGSGRFMVQVSSQRSEADAQAAYRTIQSRYPGVLGGHGHVVRRADLGSRGVYYRAMVGPFGTREEAVEVCTSLKAAGGDCLIQTN